MIIKIKFISENKANDATPDSTSKEKNKRLKIDRKLTNNNNNDIIYSKELNKEKKRKK